MKRLASCFVVSLLAAPVANASAAGVQVGTGSDGATRVIYEAANHETNSPVLTSSPAGQSFTDSTAHLFSGTGCVAGPPLLCSALPVEARLGDRDDVAWINTFIGDAIVNAGSGNDDVLVGGNLDATANGESGNDTIRITTDGQANASGGSGDDRIGGGFSQATDVFTGGSGDDLLVSTAGGRLDGESGDDTIVSTGAGISLFGGSGDDVILARRGVIDAGKDEDIVSGHDGALTIEAGSGYDLVDVAGGNPDLPPDTVSCGSDIDIVWYDSGDTIDSDCELRIRASAPTLPQVTAARRSADALLAHLPNPTHTATASAARTKRLSHAH